MAGEGEFTNPNLLLYVSDHATFAGPQDLDDQLNRLHIAQKRKWDAEKRKQDLVKAIESGVMVQKSKDGKSMVREHRLVAKLY